MSCCSDSGLLWGGDQGDNLPRHQVTSIQDEDLPAVQHHAVPGAGPGGGGGDQGQQAERERWVVNMLIHTQHEWWMSDQISDEITSALIRN